MIATSYEVEALQRRLELAEKRIEWLRDVLFLPNEGTDSHSLNPYPQPEDEDPESPPVCPVSDWTIRASESA